MLPFVALSRSHKRLHIVEKYFTLVQHINLQPLVDHARNISDSFSLVRDRYIKVQAQIQDNYDKPELGHGLVDIVEQLMDSMYDEHELEHRLVALMEQLMDSLQTGTQLLPHDLTCLKKKVKRY